jgi:hypothetical protein
MEDHADERDLIAPVEEVMPSLHRALDRCAKLGIAPTTKYFPHCQLGSHGATLDNSQPDTIIVESFWNEFPRFACLYEALCEHSSQCLGLSHDYVRKYGWEEERLVPTPTTRPWTPRAQASQQPSDRSADGSAGPSQGHPAWEALIAPIAPEVGRVLRVQLNRNQARYTLTLAAGDATVDLVLVARDDSVRALARSRSFNIFYSQVSGEYDKAAMERLLRSACDRIAANDDGSLSLDSRKGLVQLERVGKQRPRIA